MLKWKWIFFLAEVLLEESEGLGDGLLDVPLDGGVGEVAPGGPPVAHVGELHHGQLVLAEDLLAEAARLHVLVVLRGRHEELRAAHLAQQLLLVDAHHAADGGVARVHRYARLEVRAGGEPVKSMSQQTALGHN